MKSAIAKILMAFVILAALSVIQTVSAEDKIKLNEAVLKSLFENQLQFEFKAEKQELKKEDYEITNIKFVTGHFIDDKSISAIASYDGHPGRNFFARLWLLTYDNGWKLKREISFGGGMDFKIVNIGKGIRPAVWFETGGSGQGNNSFSGTLLLMGQNRDEKIYQYGGYSNEGTGKKDDFDMHHIEFKDINGDGFLEILDAEEKGLNTDKGQKIMKRIKSVYQI